MQTPTPHWGTGVCISVKHWLHNIGSVWGKKHSGPTWDSCEHARVWAAHRKPVLDQSRIWMGQHWLHYQQLACKEPMWACLLGRSVYIKILICFLHITRFINNFRHSGKIFFQRWIQPYITFPFTKHMILITLNISILRHIIDLELQLDHVFLMRESDEL